MIRTILTAVCTALFLTAPAAADDEQTYPTAAIADYVFACMASNGQSRQVLEQCSCSIDIIRSILPYDEYVEAETVMRMRLMGGEKGSLFRTDAAMKRAVDNLKRAQAEAEIRCF